MATITVTTGTTFQTMVAWPAIADMQHNPDVGTNPAINPDWLTYRDSGIAAAVALGINGLIYGVRPGYENPTPWWQQWVDGTIVRTTYKSHSRTTINSNRDPAHELVVGTEIQFQQLDYTMQQIVVPFKNALAANGESLYFVLGYNSGLDVGDTGEAIDNYFHNDSAMYARYVLSFWKRCRDTWGVTPTAWGVENEPDFGDYFYTLGSITASGTLLGNHIKAAGDALIAAGFTAPFFLVPDLNYAGYMGEYWTAINAVSGAAQYIYGLSYHLYGGPGSSLISDIGTLVGSTGKKSAMTEFQLAPASGIWPLLRRDLVNGLTSIWSPTTPIVGASGDTTENDLSVEGVYYGNNTTYLGDAYPGGTRHGPTVSTFYTLLSQYFKYVRNGATRVGATTGDSNFQPTAFVNHTTGPKTVVVVEAATSGTIAVVGLPAGTYGVRYVKSDGSGTTVSLSNITIGAGATLTTPSIPVASWVTIYDTTNVATVTPPDEKVKRRRFVFQTI